MRKLSETMMVFPSGTWVDASKFRMFLGVGFQAGADGGESVTVQLRKATDSVGTGATNFGTATTVTVPGSSPANNVNIVAAQDGRADQLGLNGSGVQYGWVSVNITDAASPETASIGFLIAGDSRSSKEYLRGLGLAGA
jgi:hypothetical protein